MPDVAVRVADPGLARQVYDLVASAHLDAGDLGPSTGLLVTDDVPEQAGTSLVPTVMVVAGEADAGVWRRAALAGVEQVVALPEGASLLGQRLQSRQQVASGTLVRIIGARGGCGATTLAVGVAAALAGQSSTTLVDADPAGSGLDVALGLEDRPGLRWPELAGVRGRVPPASVIGRLPAADGVPVLSHSRGDVDSAAAWEPVVESLLAGCRAVVADIPRYQVTTTGAPEGSVDILVVPHDVVAIANSRRLIEAGLVAPEPIIALRRIKGPMPAGSVAELLPARAVVAVPDCAAVRAGSDFGDLGRAVRSRAFAAACARLSEITLGGGGAR